MNKYCSLFKSERTPRTPVFEWIMANVLDKEQIPTILEIGSIRPNEQDPNLGFQSDGFSSFYWADYLRTRGKGNLTIVDLNPLAIEQAKVVLADYSDVDIKFIVGDGLDWAGKPGFSLVYLDGPENSDITYEMYRKINRAEASILCDDANFAFNNFGKCFLLRLFYGGYYVFNLENTSHQMMYYPKIQQGRFYVGDLELEYERSNYNSAWGNERSIEVPLGKWFLNKFGNESMEIGCVMPYYGLENHNIYDLCDTHPKNKKENALNLEYYNKNVLSLSTIEHLQKAEYNNGSNEDALRLLVKIIEDSDHFLITFPTTYHPLLDKFLMYHPEIPRVIMKRLNWENTWVVEDNSFNFNFLFGHRDGRYPDGQYNNANAVCVVTNCKELIK